MQKHEQPSTDIGPRQIGAVAFGLYRYDALARQTTEEGVLNGSGDITHQVAINYVASIPGSEDRFAVWQRDIQEALPIAEALPQGERVLEIACANEGIYGDFLIEIASEDNEQLQEIIPSVIAGANELRHADTAPVIEEFLSSNSETTIDPDQVEAHEQDLSPEGGVAFDAKRRSVEDYVKEVRELRIAFPAPLKKVRAKLPEVANAYDKGAHGSITITEEEAITIHVRNNIPGITSRQIKKAYRAERNK